MSKPLEDYALIGDCRSAALVARDGSIDCLCLPRFDANACFAALLGTEEHGYWQISPADDIASLSRRYLPNTLILETTFETETGSGVLSDFMPPLAEEPIVIRLIRCTRGEMEWRSSLRLQFDYGGITPWIHPTERGFSAIAGPDMIHLESTQAMTNETGLIQADFRLREGEETTFLLWYAESHRQPEKEFRQQPAKALESTRQWWEDWVAICKYQGSYREEVIRSLMTLKALTHEPTGGILAAPTTSLPEHLGGVRNWDYRYCWIRDSSLILQAFLLTGYTEEARQWHDWLLRAVAGDPARMQIMYGIAGERRLTESELDWLPGYEGSRPVRIGNSAFAQAQLDIYGEIAVIYYLTRRSNLPTRPYEWEFLRAMMTHLATVWREQDEGIWEVRGKASHFTYSKFMCWVGFDHAIRAAEEFGLDAPLEKWRTIRDAIHQDVCRNGFDRERATFVQSYGSSHLDASLLRMAIEQFLPPDDPRILGTIQAFEKHLINGEFVFRYHPSEEVDGLPGTEGAFLMCSFWLADNYILSGQTEKARGLFERLLLLANDVGLLSEEYDPQAERLIGNFPQGFSHMALILTAINLSHQAPTETLL
jgi:GH15 family glucan-1,4-alpha-glucosidase